MSTTELKTNLHKILDQIEDEQLLTALQSFLIQHETGKTGGVWDDFTKEQREEILIPFFFQCEARS